MKQGYLTMLQIGKYGPFTLEDFQRWFGEAKRYKGGSVAGFHESDCAYGTWNA